AGLDGQAVLSPSPTAGDSWFDLTGAPTANIAVVDVVTRNDLFRLAPLSNETQLGTFRPLDGGTEKWRGALAPDGAVFFQSRRGGYDGLFWQMPGSAEEHRVSSPGSWAADVTFAGEKLVYWSGVDGSNDMSLLLQDRDGGDRRVLTTMS